MNIYLDVNAILRCKDLVFINNDILIAIKKLSEKTDVKVILSPYFEKYLIKVNDNILPINEIGRNLLKQFNMNNIIIYDINLMEENCVVFKEEVKTFKLGDIYGNSKNR